MYLNEVWKDIPGYKGLYQISSCGRVKSLTHVDAAGRYRKEKYLKPALNKRGYYFVILTINGSKKFWWIHQLVALTFIPNPENKPTVDHIDRNRKNNNVENLRWATYLEQTHNTSKNKQVECVETGKVYDSTIEAKRQTGIFNVWQCCQGKRKTAGGYHWKYVEN